MNKKNKWTQEMWEDFMFRFQQSNADWNKMWCSFPYTHGRTVSIDTREATVYRRLYKIRTHSIESTYEAQHGTKFIYKKDETIDLTSQQVKEKGWKDRIWPREEWITFGNELKRLKWSFQTLFINEFQWTARKLCYLDFCLLDKQIGVLRNKLDEMLSQQHPDWEDFSKVFYEGDYDLQIPTRISSNLRE